jgi:hypothetical protein
MIRFIIRMLLDNGHYWGMCPRERLDLVRHMARLCISKGIWP